VVGAEAANLAAAAALTALWGALRALRAIASVTRGAIVAGGALGGTFFGSHRS
jgi:hypothetical protein